MHLPFGIISYVFVVATIVMILTIAVINVKNSFKQLEK